MHRLIVLGLFLSMSIAPSVVAWEFEWTATGPWQIDDYSLQQIPLDGEYVQNASEVELLIEGLSHTCPMDLNIFLLDPFGGGIEIIDDTGDQIPIVDFTFTFSDDGIPLPTGNDPLVNGADYLPLAPGTFGQYDGEINAGTWYLLVLDDAPNHSGEFDSFTLRGIPEPMTLSLLALGAVVALRRRRP